MMKKTFSLEGVDRHFGRQRDDDLKRGVGQGSRLSNQYGWRFIGVLASALAAASPIALAAESEVTRMTQGLLERVSFDVTSFSILGNNPLSEAETQQAIGQYVGLSRGIDDIESAADALEQAITGKGLSFYRVSFPPQELTDGTVDLLVQRYMIGDVHVLGNQHYSDKNVKASLPVLARGASPSAKEIAESLRMANENSGKRVRVTLAPGKAAEEIDAKVSVVDQSPVVFATWLNNTGTDVSGDYRVGVSAAHRNVFGRDHSASLSFISSPEGVNDVQQLAFNYKIPFYRLGGSLNLIAVESDIDSGTVGGVFDVAGRGEVYGVGYTHALPSLDRYHQSVSLQLTDKLFDNDIQFLGNQLLEDVRSRPLALTYSNSWSSLGGVDVRGSLSIANNLSGGSFNSARSYELARVGATEDWQKYDLGLSVQYAKADWIFSLASKLSKTSDRLITGEQFAVGGANSVRGMEERELRGDEGYQINLQAWAPEVVAGLRPIAFVDYGHVKNNQPLVSEVDSESVVSAGLLFNWNPTERISASASYGYLIDGVDGGDPASEASRDGDSKVHFNLAYRF